jgi:hypothetical protein
MAKDISHILGMIFMPSTAGDFLACLWDQGVINNKEEDRLGFDSQGVEELMQGSFHNFLHRPDVLPQEPGETRQRSVKKGTRKGLNHRRGMDFFAQLDETHNER